MIYPTELTVATGTTVYAGDPQSDERIGSREVRVSVTFQIDEEEDIDLADLAHEKMAEVERARLAALERIERDQADPYEPSDVSTFDPSDPALEPPDMDPPDEDAAAPDPFPEEANYLHAPCGQVANGIYSGNGHHSRNGFPTLPPTPTAGTEPVTRPQSVSEAETDWATKPQLLAIGSHFRRLGLAPADQTALLRARFGKFRPERLTKDEAAGLMRYLERGEWQPSLEAATPFAATH